jgi:diguanylate cyclase (GGDEF)-like protein
MDDNVIFSVKLKEWNRKKINAYWSITFVILLATLAGLIFVIKLSPEIASDYIISYILIPMIFLIGTVSIVEIINRYIESLNDYVFIIADSIIPVILIATFTGHGGIQLILMAPILVSAFYFDKRKVTFSCILNIFLFFLLYQFNSTLRENLSVFEVLSTIAVYLGALSIAIGIMNRGIYLISSLKETMRSEQELKIKNVLMDKNTKTDGLTELYNHKTFYEYLDSLIEQSEAYHIPLHLAIIDIDDFKKINDTYGHWVGDLILKRVADSIQESVTANDVVSRYGGEEFAVIFTEKTKEETQKLTEKIRYTISKLEHKELEQPYIFVSIGLQTYRNGSTKEIFFKDTDACLYLAKRKGKNKVVSVLDTSVIE